MKPGLLTIRNKILLMLFWEIGALLLLFLVSQHFMKKNNILLTQIEVHFVPALELGRDMEQMLTELQRAMQDAVAAAEQDRLSASSHLRDTFLALLGQGSSNPFFEGLQLEQVKNDFLRYYTLARKSSQALIEGKSVDEELLERLGKMRTQYNGLKSLLQFETIRAKLEVSLSFDEALRNSERSTRVMNLIILASSFAFGTLAFLLSRSITRPLHNLLHATNQIAKGDLSQSIAIRSTDELSILGIAMERMRNELLQFYQKLEHLVAERTRQLQESEARFRHVIASISDHIYMTVLLVDGERVHRYLSPNIEKLSGYPAAKFFNEPSFWKNLVLPEDRETLREQEKHFLQGEESEVEYRLSRPDGSIIWLRDSGRVERHATLGTVTVYGVISNISERKQAEEEQQQLQDKLRQAQRLEALGKLAGGTAHEFNNILAIMLGAIELVLSQLPKTSPERDKLEQAYKSGERGRELVKRILIFSRSSQQKRQPLPLAPIIQSAVSMIQSIVPPGIEFRCMLEPVERTVLANALQIEQIIINLCKNAIQAIPDGKGLIELRLDEREFNSAAPKYARLRIKDNGNGMPADIRKQIFEPFFTTKEVGQGTGLGLSVVHGIVQRHEGQIHVESEPGRGTTFEILLPLFDESETIQTPERATDAEPSEKLLKGNEKAHILIVDDDSTHLRLPVMALKKMGFTVTIVQECHDALKLLRQHPEQFQLVMLALTQASVKGFQLCRKITEIRPDIPLLMYADTYKAFENQKDVREFKDARFLQKPLKVRVLIQTVREMLTMSHQERRAYNGENSYH